MGFSSRSSNEPYFNRNYKNDSQLCAKINDEAFKSEYAGSGISLQEHPLKEDLNMEKRTCVACRSKNIKVIYAQRSIHPMNGDEYYDFEVVCGNCGIFSIFSFADND